MIGTFRPCGMIIGESEMTYKIEKDVPLPPARGNKNKYPFGEMSVGDSFALEGNEEEFYRGRIAASNYGARHHKKFSCRLMEEGGLRIWRVK